MPKNNRTPFRFNAEPFPVTVRKNAANGEADFYIYDEISDFGITANDVVRMLGGVDSQVINLHLNSPGGWVHDGVAIYNAFVQHPAKVVVHIDGLAASIASVIAMSGDEIRIAENAQLMIHDPWSLVIGDANDMRKEAEVLDSIKETLVTTYAARTELDVEQLRQMMADETWLNADRAVELGFADSVVSAKRPKNAVPLKRFDLTAFQHPPQDFGADNPAPERTDVPLALFQKRLELRAKQ